MPQQVAKTFCVQTRDADYRNDSVMKFTMKIDDPRSRGVKIALSSLEFPMMQYTIEEDWNRLYFSEGISFDENTFSMKISVKSIEDEVITTHYLDMPIRLNKIKSWSIYGSYAIATCEHPHSLHLLKSIDWGDVEVLCCPFGRTSLHDAFSDGNLELISPEKFKIGITNSSLEIGTLLNENNSGYLFVPPIPSPYHLCNILNYASGIVGFPIGFTFLYNEITNKIIIETFTDKKSVQILFEDSFMKNFLGIKLSSKQIGQGKTEIPTEVFPGWDYVELEAGWYSPAHRSYCTGQPLRLSQEVENSFNKLYFPLPERIPNGQVTSHFLIFTDPCGHTHTCAVPCGRYTPEMLCEYMENEMTRLASSTTEGVEFTVQHTNDRFSFSCEIKEDGKLSSAPFSLLLNHNMQFDPSKIGFSPQPLMGCDNYTSDKTVHFPVVTTNKKETKPLNIYRISDIGHKKKMKIHASAPIVLTGIIIGYDTNTSTLVLRTYLGQLPYSHGYKKGDVVKLASSKKADIYVFDEEDGWKESSAEPCSLPPKFGKSAVVLGLQEKQKYEMCSVVLKVRNSPQYSSCIGKALQIHSFVQPFNFCFNLYKSIKPDILGFQNKTLLWGVDGSVSSGSLMIPPYDAPNCHNLDHPDYVIMTLDESKSTSLQHTHGEINKNIFAKIVLYPLAREGGMMPKDASLVGGSNLSNYTLRFFNPDFTPYHFHGAEFSFSMTLIDVIGE